MSAAEKLKALEAAMAGRTEVTLEGQVRVGVEARSTFMDALPQIVAVVEAGQSIYLGFTCPQDPMDCDERLERFAAALAALDEALS